MAASGLGRMSDTTHFKLARMSFFACTVWAYAPKTKLHLEFITWDSLKFDFPSATVRPRGPCLATTECDACRPFGGAGSAGTGTAAAKTTPPARNGCWATM